LTDTTNAGRHVLPVPRAALERSFTLKYGAPDRCFWGPRMRWRSGYFTPDDHYEALLDTLVRPGTAWLDVGCGRFLFPSHPNLARELADRSGDLTGLDPDPTLEENPYTHHKVRATFDDWTPDRRYDLVSMRMVAEHVEFPERIAASLASCTAPGGHVVIYTVHRFAPVPLMTSIWPFALRHGVKRWLWGTEEKDTFPTFFRMNTRRSLERLLTRAGFESAGCELLDDCRTLARFKVGQRFELGLRRLMRAVGLRYPEVCILGVWRRRSG
jgi:SAM-dependent methyltransferase